LFANLKTCWIYQQC